MFSQRSTHRRLRTCMAALLALFALTVASGPSMASSSTDGVNQPCADQTSGGVLSGETRICNSSQVFQFIRLGSAGRDHGIAGDSLYLVGAPPGLLISAYVPILNQPAARLGDNLTLAQHMAIALSEATGLPYYSMAQGHLGTVAFIAGQASLTFLPVGDIIVNAAAPDGLTYLDDGRAQITVNGLTVTLVSTAIPITDLMAQLVSMDPQARLELTTYGLMKATFNGTVYPLWPGFAANSLTGVSGSTKWQVESDNLIHLTFPSPYQQTQVPAFSGMEQILYPAFDDLTALTQTFLPYDPALRVGSRMDGTYTAIFQGSLIRLSPAYTLVFPVPAAHQRDLWWTDGALFYFQNLDGSAQGFAASAIPENTINVSSWTVGSTIPAAYTCEGVDKSIPLIWSGASQYTQSYAIIVDDPDAAATVGSTQALWNVYNISPWVHGVADGASQAFMPAGAVEVTNSFGKAGYTGPCPPTTHHYYIKVYALKNLITLPTAPMTRSQFELAYGTQIIGSGLIVATFTP